MTPAEYIQLKAFARQDGVIMAALWIVGFACYLRGLIVQPLGMLALVVILCTPFVLMLRLRHFRDASRGGVLSFARGYAYSILVFFYGGVLLAVAQYLYFAFIDHGFFLTQMQLLLSSQESRQLLEQAGMADMAAESLAAMGDVRPIDYALNMLSMVILLGFVLGIPVAAATKRVEN